MESNLLLDLALILFATKIFGLLTKKLHLPQVVGALLSGIILGPALLGIVMPNEYINILAELGVIILMFTAGLETDFAKLRELLRPSLIIAALGVAVSVGGGFILAYSLGMGVFESIFIGVILSGMSASITIEALREMGKLKTKTGVTILGASAIDDVLSLIVLSVFLASGNGGLSVSNTGMTLIMIIVFFAFAAICGFAVFIIFDYLSKRGMKRNLSVFGLAFCFLMATAANFFGLESILGAYIAGLVLCHSKAERYIEVRSETLSFMFFSPVFFVSVGLKTSFDGLDRASLIFAGLFFAVALVTKFIGCGLGAKINKYSLRDSVRIGVGMITRCEVAIIAATIGAGMGFLDQRYFSGIIIAVIATTLITPILLKIAFMGKSDDSV